MNGEVTKDYCADFDGFTPRYTYVSRRSTVDVLPSRAQENHPHWSYRRYRQETDAPSEPHLIGDPL